MIQGEPMKSQSLNTWLRLLALLVFLPVLMVGAAGAQVVTGSISGQAADPTGALVPDANVTLTNQATGATQKTATSADGAFRFTGLSVGKYDLEITKAGFSKLKMGGVAADANIEHALGKLQLQLGQTSESIEVSATPSLIEATQSQISSDITGEALQTFSGTSGQPRFQSGGYWFVIAEPWPVGWAYTDQCYIDYVDGEYFLFDLLHPGVRLAITVVL
jgi:hypothetical protein